jgi:hypothetical protein
VAHRVPALLPALDHRLAEGWGADAQPAPGRSAEFPPDAPPTEPHGVYPEFHIPALHFPHPVTGRAPQYPEGDTATSKPIGFGEPGQAAVVSSDQFAVETLPARLLAAEARAQRSLAYDAVENLINAYAFYLDECLTQEAADLGFRTKTAAAATIAPRHGRARTFTRATIADPYRA